MQADFNPSFSFNTGQGNDDYQAPWEFKGALEQVNISNGTSIDFKIQKHATTKPNTNGGTRKRAADDFAIIADDSGSVQHEKDDEQQHRLKNIYGKKPKEKFNKKQKQSLHSNTNDKEQQQPDAASSPSDQEQDNEDDDDALEQQHKNHKAIKKQSKSSFFNAAPEGTTFAAASFADLNLSRPLVRACAALGYLKPTPIQAACIPLALTGRDICGSAITGSGKTAAFSLPLLERLMHRSRRVAATYVLVLTPTRELAVQVHSMIQKLAQFTDVQAALVVGGLSLQAQAAALRAGPEIVVATPGRLIDHVHNSQGFGLEDLAALVLDEADRLLEMGFAEEIKEIVRMSPTKRQTLLFSATMTEEVNALVALSLRHPVRLAADAAAASPANLHQEVVRLKGSGAAMKKEATLLALVSRSFASSGRCIIFFSTKQRAHRAKILFGLAGLPTAAELHGDMTQAARLESLERFRKGEVAFLLATDVAARGLDILGVEVVINYDCPKTLASYLHRVGRTARAGSNGLAVTVAEDGDRNLLKEVVKKGGVDLQQRVVPVPAVASWYEKISGMESQVGDVLGEEREEKELRRAEMEAQKAANMIEHETEIYSRPARTWFQSEKEKRDVAAQAKDASSLDSSIRKKIDKNTAKSARRMERKIAASKEKEAGSEKQQTGIKVNAGMVRALKAREAALREEGIPASRAGRIAASMVAGPKKNKTGKKKQAVDTSKDGHGLFGGDGVKESSGSGVGTRVYAGGARSGKARLPKEMAKAAQKKGRKGKGGGFKSKSRHKRR